MLCYWALCAVIIYTVYSIDHVFRAKPLASQETGYPQLCKGNKILCCLPVPLSAADPPLIFVCVQIAAPCFPGIDTPYVTQRSQRSSDCSRETLPSSSTASATTVPHQPYSYRRASPFRCTANSAPMSNACRVKGAGQSGARSAVTA
jgi:hypothetical protein